MLWNFINCEMRKNSFYGLLAIDKESILTRFKMRKKFDDENICINDYSQNLLHVCQTYLPEMNYS